MTACFPILLVEDDDVDVMAVRRASERAGLRNPLHVVPNGREALAFLRHEGPHAAQRPPRPGLIILDLNMPVMDGIEFLEEAGKDPLTSTIPIVVLTSSVDEGDRLAGYALGASGWLLKPMDGGSLAAVVQAAARSWHSSGPT